MVTHEQVNAYRNGDNGPLLSGRLLVPLTLWSIFFALAVLGGLLS
jgi:hypothetical protein